MYLINLCSCLTLPCLCCLKFGAQVGELKERLAGVLGLAASRQKLSRDGVGFLKDEFSLAHYNVDPDVTLQLGAKDRGKGRK